MNTKKLYSSQYPKMLANLSQSNQFYKLFSLIALLFALISLVIATSLINKDPIVLTLTTEGKVLEKAQPTKVEDLTREAISHYLEKRYSWEPSNIQEKLKDSSYFISPTSQKAFAVAMENITRFSKEKQVTQKVYPSKIVVNVADGTVLITGDRVTSVQGLKAAGNLKLQLSFESGKRTELNPWGIYITKEKEEQ